MKVKSVRELGGEMWAEMESCRRYKDPSPIALQKLSADEISALADFLMQLLARHSGSVIQNDQDLPVTPLPKRY